MASERKLFDQVKAEALAGSSAKVQLHSLGYDHRLNFYDVPPIQDVSIEDFENWGLDRLRVLAEIESSFVRNRTQEELHRVTTNQCNKYLPLSSNSAYTKDLQAERKKDHVSHFILRLAFCRSEELRQRFVKAEMALFRFRYETDDTAERARFLNSRNFGWQAVEPREKEALKSDLLAASPLPKGFDFDKDSYCKVSWTRVPDLVSQRKVLLKQGFAYVPLREQSSAVFHAFQTHLEKALEDTAKAIPRLDEDTRVLPILSNLSSGFLAGVSSEWMDASPQDASEALTADMINELARLHFPLCMRNLHDNLRRKKALKHFGRLQYGLFLKVLGLPVEEALTFWRKSFSSLTDDKFKEHRYNIRHSYGLEGGRKNYSAFSCKHNITGNPPGPEECHGCPYRHFSPENLQTALISTYSSQGLTTADVPEIMSAVKGGHYNVACTRVFEITHASFGVKKGDGIDGETVNHPNQYAAGSRELARGTQEQHKAKEEDVSMP